LTRVTASDVTVCSLGSTSGGFDIGLDQLGDEGEELAAAQRRTVDSGLVGAY
jgi:hypothetical protein